MILSLTTDYVTSTGSPESYLRRIAEAGFSHVHWCHEWCTDRLYSPVEIAEIGGWLKEFGLACLNVHASVGTQNQWISTHEPDRRIGTGLVKNRLELAAQLGADVVIIHVAPVWNQLCRSLDELQPVARACGVRIAFENMVNDDFTLIHRLIAAYPPDFAGLCYDSGHGNIGGRGLDHLSTLRDRLIAVHLHDNDGKEDLHGIIGTGTVDWPRLARILAASAYDKGVNCESTLKHNENKDECKFLSEAFTAAGKFAELVRTSSSAPRRTAVGRPR